jgi:hypothetical protein
MQRLEGDINRFPGSFTIVTVTPISRSHTELQYERPPNLLAVSVIHVYNAVKPDIILANLAITMEQRLTPLTLITISYWYSSAKDTEHLITYLFLLRPP